MNPELPEAMKLAARSQLKKIQASSAFKQAPRLRRFLEFTVEEAIRGRSVNEAIVAATVFDRDPGSDPGSIVRTNARRIRQRLEEYYSSEGLEDPVRIVLDPGGYVPRFVIRAEGAEERVSANEVIPPPEEHISPSAISNGECAVDQPARVQDVSASVSAGLICVTMVLIVAGMAWFAASYGSFGASIVAVACLVSMLSFWHIRASRKSREKMCDATPDSGESSGLSPRDFGGRCAEMSNESEPDRPSSA
ncbi:MAG TPA: hypothetical protein VHB50_01610 [Bryobacteraceae bacterium]|nr:hypothetical protein [Bryobacteraceae bacterium]